MKNVFTIDELISFNTFWKTAVDIKINNWSTGIYLPQMLEFYSDRLLFLKCDDYNYILKELDLEFINDEIKNWIKVQKQ